MNCVRCQYLLWNLPQQRCPECGLEFELTDYVFPKNAVEFSCRECGETYPGTDEQGLPGKRRFPCKKCSAPIEVARMQARPLDESVHGEPLRAGTPWQFRHRVGFVRAFFDCMARLAIGPGDFFALSAASDSRGALLFGVLCSYLAAGIIIGVLVFLNSIGVLGWLSIPKAFRNSTALALMIVAMPPLIQIVWSYFYGAMIYAVLHALGLSTQDLEQSIRAVSYGSAVLPAVLLLPPVGVVWYVNVVSSGVEHLQQTTRPHAIIASIVPMLLAANLILLLVFVVF
jgi:hypothetical protein